MNNNYFDGKRMNNIFFDYIHGMATNKKAETNEQRKREMKMKIN